MLKINETLTRDPQKVWQTLKKFDYPVKVRGKLTRCVGNEKLEIIFLCILYRNFPYYHFRIPDIFHIFFHLSPLRHR